ncbi:MAG: mechanosensitive ion channel family protein [Bacilli bacterium]|nr:mechanosensitive ion channel family protein [Bacilli bacterium]
MKEEERKIEEIKDMSREAKNALIYGTDSKGQPKKEGKPWAEKDKSEKIHYIVSWSIFGIEVLYVVLIILAGALFPGSFLGNVLISYKPDVSQPIEVGGAIMLSLFFVLLLLGISKIIRTALNITSRKTNNKGKTIIKIINSTVKYLTWIVLAFILLGIWGVDTTTIIASAGIVALIIGLGAQTLIADVISGCTIVFENEFDVGDTVVIDDFRGVVTDIGLSCTKITDVAGNTKSIRNSQINTAINLSQEMSLAVVDVPLDYGEDFRAIRKLFEENLTNISKQVPDVIGEVELLGMQEFKDSAVILRLIAHTREENKFAVTRKLNEVIFLLLKDNGIEIPFNQIVVSQREEK